MVAKVHSLMSRSFIDNSSGGLTITSINAIMVEIAATLNAISLKLRNRGYTMNDIVLDKIVDITQVAATLNININKINTYLSNINLAFAQNYMLSKEVLETMKIEVVNNDGISSVTVFDNRLEVSLSNGQSVSVKKDEVISIKDIDIQTITHA